MSSFMSDRSELIYEDPIIRVERTWILARYTFRVSTKFSELLA